MDGFPGEDGDALRAAMRSGFPVARPALIDGELWVSVELVTVDGPEPLLDVPFRSLGFRPGPGGPELVR